MKVVAAIPARLGSTRLKNKALLCETGKPLVVHTAENTALAKSVDDVVVVTDSDAIFKQCRYNNVKVEYLQCDAWCGTARIASAVKAGLIDADVILNVQCDEPCIQASSLDELVGLVWRIDYDAIGTLVAPLMTVADFANENITKADVDYAGHCHYFARGGWFARAFHHVGVYGFRKQTLLKAGALPQSERSKKVSLEQVTWCDAGYQMWAVFVDSPPFGINTEEDYRRYVESRRVLEKAG